jgi:hypothetical protein
MAFVLEGIPQLVGNGGVAVKALRAFSLLGLAVVMAACDDPLATTSPTPSSVTSSPEIHSAPPSLGPSPSPEITPTPELTVEQLAAAYLACVDPYNEGIDEVRDGLEGAATLKLLKRLMRKASRLVGDVGDCVQSIAWPAEYERDVRKYLRANAGLQVSVLAIARAEDLFAVNLQLRQFQRAASKAATESNFLRSLLGLPPPPR